jgi:hypothetical protein
MGAWTKSQDRCRPRASMPYSLSAVLFLTGPIPFVNEEDFRSPLLLLPALRRRPVRLRIEIECSPLLFDITSACLCFLSCKILSIQQQLVPNNPKFLACFTIIYTYYSITAYLCQSRSSRLRLLVILLHSSASGSASTLLVIVGHCLANSALMPINSC